MELGGKTADFFKDEDCCQNEDHRGDIDGRHDRIEAVFEVIDHLDRQRGVPRSNKEDRERNVVEGDDEGEGPEG